MSRIPTLLQFLGLVAFLAATPRSVLAQDDGGTRSSFAHGAGVRSLSLGGAFVAIADDASAAIWNPGGLGQLQRNEFQASHATLYGIGFNEQYAFMSFPSWRWGVVGLSLRHFGVDGVELRDEFNGLASESLSRNETEIALAYGQRLGYWNLGLSAKLRRLSFGGYAAEGLGLDLGLLGHPAAALGIRRPWARRLRTGVTIRNVIEPAFRLDEESVPDPTGVQLGVAYETPFSIGNSMLLALDLEKTRDVGARLHAGVEVRLYSLFALRAGLNNGAVTLGSEARWRGLAVNFSYEDNEIGPVQRIGLSLLFGSSIDERRQAWLDTEETAFQDKLARRFSRRQEERVAGLLVEARQAHAAGRLGEALEILGTADALDPGRTEVTTLEAACYREQGEQLEAASEFAAAAMQYSDALAVAPGDSVAAQGIRRCRTRSNDRSERNARIREVFEAALDALVAEEFSSARAGFESILAERPGDEEASAMLERTSRVLNQRTATLIQQAKALVAARNFDLAEEMLQRAAALDGEADGLQGARTALEQSRREWVARAAEAQRLLEEPDDPSREDTATDKPASTAVAAVALTPEREQELSNLYDQGVSALKAGRVDEAIRYLELVWSMKPDFRHVRTYLSREYVTRGMELFATRDLQQAIATWEEALRIDPQDARTLDYLARARGRLARLQTIDGEKQGVKRAK